jgi:hypothetical protein
VTLAYIIKIIIDWNLPWTSRVRVARVRLDSRVIFQKFSPPPSKLKILNLQPAAFPGSLSLPWIHLICLLPLCCSQRGKRQPRYLGLAQNHDWKVGVMTLFHTTIQNRLITIEAFCITMSCMGLYWPIQKPTNSNRRPLYSQYKFNCIANTKSTNGNRSLCICNTKVLYR